MHVHTLICIDNMSINAISFDNKPIKFKPPHPSALNYRV